VKNNLYITTLIILAVLGTVFVALLSNTVPEAEAASESRYDIQFYDGTVSSMNGETHIYHFGGATPTTPYARFYNRITQQIYNSTDSVLGPKASVLWADSEVLMTDETGSVGGWLLVVPAEVNMADGWYDILIYERVTGTPLSTDTLYLGRSCRVHNGIVISFDDR